MGAVNHDDVLILHRLRYGDDNLIVRALTAGHGPLTFMAREGRRSPVAQQCLPGALLHLGWKTSGGRALPRILSAQPLFPQQVIFFNPVRYALASFMAECLHRFLPLDQPCESDYFQEAFTFLRRVENEEKLAELPLLFLARLCQIAGIAPVNENTHDNLCFDLYEAHWLEAGFAGEATLQGEDARLWHSLFYAPHLPPLTRPQRRRLLENLCRFIQWHHNDTFELKSLTVYQEIF